MKIKHSRILDKLFLLLLVFIIAIIALASVHLFFLNLQKELDKKTDNLVAKISIGELISEDLHIIRSDFYELSTAITNKKGRDLLSKKINEKIDGVENMLDILQNGGKLSRIMRLNIAGHNTALKEIVYENENKGQIPLEVIDLKPKLKQIREMVKKVDNLLDSSDKLLKYDPISYAKSVKSIKRYDKATPAFFIRITENNRRLLYEGENELKSIQRDIVLQKEKYFKLEIIMLATTIIIVLILGYFISRQIKKTNEELFDQKASTRSILDAQPNIVIVTDGYEMRDVNASLFRYLTKYKTLDEFKKNHRCICDYFTEPDIVDSDDYITKKVYDDVVWAEYAYMRPDKTFKVCMKLKEDEYSHFVLNVKRRELLNQEYIMVISFNDITNEIHNQRELKELNDSLEARVLEKTKELQELNENLEQRIMVELDKNRQKDQQMIQQSRFAALGEMIGNIAHQWRQPLSAISSTASGIQLQMQLGLISNEEVEQSLRDIMNYVRFLTQTIEDFRGFFKKDKERVEFNINEILDKTLKITNASYKDSEIEIFRENKNEEYLIEGFPSELTQVFLNVLNNAKDALIEKKFNEKWVYISVNKIENNIEIVIHDSAGGIPKNIIDKIFDPYFTTKHQSQGTGIGLYMSKDIVEKHMQGSIKVINDDIEINGKKYFGAKFIVKVPKL